MRNKQYEFIPQDNTYSSLLHMYFSAYLCMCACIRRLYFHVYLYKWNLTGWRNTGWTQVKEKWCLKMDNYDVDWCRVFWFSTQPSHSFWFSNISTKRNADFRWVTWSMKQEHVLFTSWNQAFLGIHAKVFDKYIVCRCIESSVFMKGKPKHIHDVGVY